MLLQCLGHSKFLMTLSTGYRIVTDPFDVSTGYPVGHVRADAVLVSHHHHDHDAVDTVQGYTKVVDTAGVHTLEQDIQVTALSSFHDEVQGAKRGTNLIMVLLAEGLRIVHMGDLGHLPDDALMEKIGRPDLLLIPVGGFFTIDAEQAVTICEKLQPAVIIPMHYRTEYNASWPIAPLEEFLKVSKDRLKCQAEEVDCLRVTREDMRCQPHMAILRPKAI